MIEFNIFTETSPFYCGCSVQMRLFDRASVAVGEEYTVCMDEMPYQLLDDSRSPLPARCKNTQKIDYEYVRNGTCSVFAFIEPLAGHHHISVRERRTAVDWAEEIKFLVDEMYPDAEKIILVMDNLNTHVKGSLYKKYPPEEARRLIKRLEFH